MAGNSRDTGLPTTQKVPRKRAKKKPFPISAINLLLYQGLSLHFGIDEEERDKDHNRIIFVRHLNPNDPLTGFPGKIRYMMAFEHSHLELYDHIHSDDPVLEFVGGPSRGGVWAHGRGDLMVETLTARFHITRGLNLQSLATALIGRIIEAAGELAKDPECSCDKFWTTDRYK
jgi:hypothetical protein